MSVPSSVMRGELAGRGDGRDITRGFTYQLLQPLEDQVLRDKGGDLRVYQDVLRDDQVRATFQQRRLAVTGAEWDVEPGEEGNSAAEDAADALRENLRALEWDSITNGMLYGAWYGHAVAEVMWEPRDSLMAIADIKVRNRRRFRYGEDFQRTEGRDLYLLTVQRPQGERMPERKFWTLNTGADHDDEPYGVGLGHWCYWPVYFKRSGIRFWLIYLEKFGQPTATAAVDAGRFDDEPYMKAVREALQAIQTDAGVIIPKGVEFALLEATRSGTSDYDTMRAAMDAAISKIILSQTMTTDDGSSRSQAEVHMDVRQEVTESDARMINASFRRQVARWWTDLNFGEDVPAPFIVRHTEPEEDTNERAERDERVYGMGFRPTLEYIHEHYGEGWEERQESEPGEANPLTLPPVATAAAFAEALAQGAHRQDQAAIAFAAAELANGWPALTQPQVAELMAFAEQSGDLEATRAKVAELMARGPDDATVRAFRNPMFFTRLMGMLRGQDDVDRAT